MKLVATNDEGSDSIVKTDYIYVSAPEKPVADFTANTRVVKGSENYFNNYSLNNPTSWNWTFPGGDPSSSTDQSPIVTYNTTGNFTVKLCATNAAGTDTIIKTDYITVIPPLKPIADFYTYYASYFAGDDVQYNDNSTNSPTSWNWTFPGGSPSTSTSMNPIVVYNTSGIYDAQLIVSNAQGADTVIKTSYVSIWLPSKPYAYFYAFKTNIVAGSSVDFTDCSSNNTTSWKWIFPGGSPSMSTLQNPTIVYNTPGTYDVRLIASNAQGSDSTIQYGYIVVLSPQRPIADFYTYKTDFFTGDYVYFYDNSANFPTSWKWTFDGGTPSESTDQNPYTMYTTPGIYDVKLEVSNAQGSDSYTQYAYIKVAPSPYPIPSFILDHTWVCGNGEVIFTSTSTGPIRDYLWNFGDDAVPATANTEGPHTVTYNKPGYKAVTLTLNNNCTTYGSVIAYSIPPTPVISMQDNELVSNAANGNQWYSTIHGKIEGAINQRFKPLNNDEYFVIVTVDGCSSDASNKLSFALSISDLSNMNVKVYPNPIKDNLVIETEDQLKSAVIYDLDGRLIQTLKLSGFNRKYVFKLSMVKSGMYNLKIVSNKEAASYRIVKIE